MNDLHDLTLCFVGDEVKVKDMYDKDNGSIQAENTIRRTTKRSEPDDFRKPTHLEKVTYDQ